MSWTRQSKGILTKKIKFLSKDRICLLHLWKSGDRCFKLDADSGEKQKFTIFSDVFRDKMKQKFLSTSNQSRFEVIFLFTLFTKKSGPIKSYESYRILMLIKRKINHVYYNNYTMCVVAKEA